jgi:hypothetical protein
MVGRRSVSIAIIGLGLLSGSVRAAPLAPPGLTVTRVTASQQGRTLRIRDVVHNNGPKTAATSTTGYYLGRVRIGARRTGQLAPGMSSIGVVTLRIPRTLRPGAYRLRACADDHYKLRLIHCRAAAKEVIAPDRTPPVFTGLTQAVTCIPGPIVPGRSSRYALNWTAASDDGTPRSGIVYDIYQATTSGGEDFTTPTYTSEPGASAFTTPLLSNDDNWYFVVRARDQAGNRDSNTVERRGFNQCV